MNEVCCGKEDVTISQVNSCLTRLAEEINRAGEIQEKVMQRTVSVVMAFPVKVPAEDQEKESLVPLARELRQLTTMLKEQSDSYDALLRNMEL